MLSIFPLLKMMTSWSILMGALTHPTIGSGSPDTIISLTLGIKVLVSVFFMLSAFSLVSNETADPESSIISKVLPASSSVRVEALNLTTDTITILSLFRPTGKRGARGPMCQTPLCSFPVNIYFQHGHTDHKRSSVDYYHSGV